MLRKFIIGGLQTAPHMKSLKVLLSDWMGAKEGENMRLFSRSRARNRQFYGQIVVVKLA